MSKFEELVTPGFDLGKYNGTAKLDESGWYDALRNRMLGELTED
ncbi:MAG: hypothetical protein ACJAS1_007346 [Oleiphilaceae bacterium]|jgi:hypothetical protein